ncbi:hypothetical protein CEXT_148961, partial [Caerostris extrusa]
ESDWRGNLGFPITNVWAIQCVWVEVLISIWHGGKRFGSSKPYEFGESRTGCNFVCIWDPDG